MSLCSSGIPFARGPWWRITATWSWSSSPRSKAARKSRLVVEDARGRGDDAVLGRDRGDLHHRAAERAVEHADAAVGGERVAHAGAGRSSSRVSRGAGRQRSSSALVEVRLVAVAAEAVARDGVDVRVHQAGVEQLADQERHAAGGVEVVDVGRAVGVDARQQRRRRRSGRRSRPRSGACPAAAATATRCIVWLVEPPVASSATTPLTSARSSTISPIGAQPCVTRRGRRRSVSARAQRRAGVDEARARAGAGPSPRPRAGWSSRCRRRCRCRREW